MQVMTFFGCNYLCSNLYLKNIKLYIGCSFIPCKDRDDMFETKLVDKISFNII